jgi:hypothetical protein
MARNDGKMRLGGECPTVVRVQQASLARRGEKKRRGGGVFACDGKWLLF